MSESSIQFKFQTLAVFGLGLISEVNFTKLQVTKLKVQRASVSESVQLEHYRSGGGSPGAPERA